MRLQRQLATLSPRADFIVAQGSGHDIQIDRAGTVVDAIRQMVRQATEESARGKTLGLMLPRFEEKAELSPGP